MSDELIQIEIAYALPEEQYLFVNQVKKGTTVDQALKASEELKQIPELVINQVGIFGKQVKPDQELRAGDRIEIYRPLKADPKDRRRKQVEADRQAEKDKKEKSK